MCYITDATPKPIPPGKYPAIVLNEELIKIVDGEHKGKVLNLPLIPRSTRED